MAEGAYGNPVNWGEYGDSLAYTQPSGTQDGSATVFTPSTTTVLTPSETDTAFYTPSGHSGGTRSDASRSARVGRRRNKYGPVTITTSSHGLQGIPEQDGDDEQDQPTGRNSPTDGFRGRLLRTQPVGEGSLSRGLEALENRSQTPYAQDSTQYPSQTPSGASKAGAYQDHPTAYAYGLTEFSATEMMDRVNAMYSQSSGNGWTASPMRNKKGRITHMWCQFSHRDSPSLPREFREGGMVPISDAESHEDFRKFFKRFMPKEGKDDRDSKGGDRRKGA